MHNFSQFWVFPAFKSQTQHSVSEAMSEVTANYRCSVHPALVLCSSSIPEKVSINQKDEN